MAKCIEKVCWPPRITPGNRVLLGVPFRLQYQVAGFKGSQQHTS